MAAGDRHLLFLGFQLTVEACWTRLRQGRGPFSPTLPARSRRPRSRASLDGGRLSPETYLRPTRNRDGNAPELVGLADEVRARTGSDWEYARAIFDLVRDEIDPCFDLSPGGGVVETLERGFGMCHDKLNVFIALARAGGIPARYCTIGLGPGREGVVSLTMPDHSATLDVLSEPSRWFLAEKNDPREDHAHHRQRRDERLVAVLLVAGQLEAEQQAARQELQPDEPGESGEVQAEQQRRPERYRSGQVVVDTSRGLGVLFPLAVATVARAWRAWWIDVRQDPAMAHVRFDTRERRTRRMFGFVALILWIALLSRLEALEMFGPRFFASVAAFAYCFLPFVVAEGDKLRRKAAALKEPS